MKKAMLWLFLTALVPGMAPLRADEHPHGSEEHPKAAKTSGAAPAKAGESLTVQGEVLDMACYMAHEGKGAKHAKCAQKCIDGGAPAGLLTDDGKVYLLVEDHNNTQPYESVKKMAAQRVKVTGKAYDRGGVQGLVVASAEAAK